MDKKICLIGLGHVGLTLAAILADKGFDVFGVEINPVILESLKNALPHFFEDGLGNLLKRHLGKKFHVNDKLPKEGADIYIIAVGTPYDNIKKKPNLEILMKACEELATSLPDGALILLRSTVPIGTSHNLLIPIFQKTGKEFQYAVTPERTIEGIALKELLIIPQIIGAIDNKSFKRAKAFFEKFAPAVVKAESLEMAETAKLLSNSWRDTTFAFANEVALLAKSLGIDAVKLINLVNNDYERGGIPLPGLVGGPCITKDPYHLISSGAEAGYQPLLVSDARKINESMIERMVTNIISKLRQLGKDHYKSKFFLMGIAFKGNPQTDDLRGSSALDLLRFLTEHGVKEIYCHDFVVKPDQLTSHGLTPVSLEEGFRNADCACIVNNHTNYRNMDIQTLANLMNKPALIWDCWHLLENVEGIKDIIYTGLGF